MEIFSFLDWFYDVKCKYHDILYVLNMYKTVPSKSCCTISVAVNLLGLQCIRDQYETSFIQYAVRNANILM